MTDLSGREFTDISRFGRANEFLKSVLLICFPDSLALSKDEIDGLSGLGLGFGFC